MTRRRMRNTVIIILCCVLILSIITISQSKKKSHSLDETYDKLWDWITGAKDTLEGIERLVGALKVDLQEAKDDLQKTKTRKKTWFNRRSIIKKSIQPLEQQENAAKERRDLAVKDHNKAINNKASLQKEADAILLQMKYATVSPSSESLQRLEELTQAAKNNYDNYVKMCDGYYCTTSCYYCNEQQSLYAKWQRYSQQLDLKKSEVRLNEIANEIIRLNSEIEAEKKVYDKAVKEIRKLREKLGGIGFGPRWTIYQYSMEIKYCDDAIEKLEAKIKKLEAELKQAKEDRKNLDSEIQKEEEEWKKLKKEAKENPDEK